MFPPHVLAVHAANMYNGVNLLYRMIGKKGSAFFRTLPHSGVFCEEWSRKGVNMFERFDLTDNERVSAAYEACRIQNLMSRFASAQELGREAEAFQALWSSREDISFGDNQGFYVGRTSVENFWVQGRTAMRQADAQVRRAVGGSDIPGAGDMERHNMMSPLIEVSRDGQTAKGMWYCPGVRTRTEADGHTHLTWHYVRYGVDFILEAEQWRLWHVFEGSEFAFEMGHGYIPGTGMKPVPDATVYAPNPAVAGLPLGRQMLPERDLSVKTYSIEYGWSPYPAVPVPYDTFENTFSYGPEPWKAIKEAEA